MNKVNLLSNCWIWASACASRRYKAFTKVIVLRRRKQMYPRKIMARSKWIRRFWPFPLLTGASDPVPRMYYRVERKPSRQSHCILCLKAFESGQSLYICWGKVDTPSNRSNPIVSPSGDSPSLGSTTNGFSPNPWLTLVSSWLRFE